MDKSKLSDNEWEQVLARLRKVAGIRIACEAACRQFVFLELGGKNAILFIFRNETGRCLQNPGRFNHGTTACDGGTVRASTQEMHLCAPERAEQRVVPDRFRRLRQRPSPGG